MPIPTPSTGGRLNLTAFYAVVAVIALAGQAIAAVTWLGWHPLPAVLAVAALEFGGIVLSIHADGRRRLGERAGWARGLSAAVAGFAVAFNWFGHTDHLQGGFFAGMSALGYLVWLLDSGARRRDELRAAKKLPPVAPAYGSIQWIRHPWLTRRARLLALAQPTLGLYGSLAAAGEQIRTERRRAAIATALRVRIIKAVKDPVLARLTLATVDLDEVAERLRAGFDYDGLTALIAEDLIPARVAAVPLQVPPVEAAAEPVPVAVEAEPAPEPQPAVEIIEPSAQTHRPRRLVLRRVGPATRVVRVHRRRGQDRPPTQPTSPQPRRPVEETRRYALALMAGDPQLRRKDVAGLLGITTRRLREIVPAAETTSPAVGGV